MEREGHLFPKYKGPPAGAHPVAMPGVPSNWPEGRQRNGGSAEPASSAPSTRHPSRVPSAARSDTAAASASGSASTIGAGATLGSGSPGMDGAARPVELSEPSIGAHDNGRAK